MPLTFFKCSKCKATKNSYKEAVKCEKSHLPAVSVKEIEYTVGAYPFRVMITFPDGKEFEYEMSLLK